MRCHVANRARRRTLQHCTPPWCALRCPCRGSIPPPSINSLSWPGSAEIIRKCTGEAFEICYYYKRSLHTRPPDVCTPPTIAEVCTQDACVGEKTKRKEGDNKKNPPCCR